MQRPLHARFLKDDASLPNRQPYVPSYPNGQLPSPVDHQYQNGGSAFYYPNSPANPAYFPVPSSSSASGSPDRPRRRTTASVPSSKRPSGHSRTMSERPRRVVYDAPITYSTPRNQTSPTRNKFKRRFSEPERPLLGGETQSPTRESLLDPGAGQSQQQPDNGGSPISQVYLGHIFMSLSSSNVLKLKHVPRSVPDNVLLDPLLSVWRNGILDHRRSRSDWQVTFNGAPWTCKGELGFQARRIVVVLFQILGDAVRSLSTLWTIH